jgi:hypothetical protein
VVGDLGLIGYNTFSIRGEEKQKPGKTATPTFNIVGERHVAPDVQAYIEENSGAPYYSDLTDAIVSGAIETTFINQLPPSLHFAPQDINVSDHSTGINSPQLQVFNTMLTNTWNANGGVYIDTVLRDTTPKLFSYITNAILKKLTSKVSKNARTFDFGYDSSLTHTLHPLDPEKYGGTEENPPFWVEQPQYGGWLGLYDKMVPETDGCENEPLIDFKEIGNIVDDYNTKFKNDPRLQAPNPSCIPEPVYNRILAGAAAAGIEGMIRATCRLYIIESMIKGMPVFSLFDTKYPEMFDETLFSYLSEKMKIGLIETSRNKWGRLDLTEETYYYIFLEQVVQNFDRKVKLGEVIPTTVEQSALDRIRAYQDTWVEPSSCSNLENVKFPARRKAIKRCRQAKRGLFIKYMIKTQTDALVILNRYLAQELDSVGSIFRKAFTPNVRDFPSLLFGSPEWMIAGAISAGGPLNVPMDVYDTSQEPVSTIIAAGEPGTKDQLIHSNAGEPGTYFPFVLEKYIRVEKYSSQDEQPEIDGARLSLSAIASSPSWDASYGVINIDDWRSFLASNEWNTTGSPSIPIRALFKKWSFGLRISFKMPESITADSRWPTGPYFPSENREQQKSLQLGSDSDPTFILPLLESEIEINKDQNISAGIMNQFDLNALACQMIESVEYKTLFNYCFPLPGLLSLVTIYTMETFLLALGEEWGTDEATGGEQGGKGGSQFYRWDPDFLFKRTKKILRKGFQSYYYSSDSEYNDSDELSPEQRSRQKLRIKKKLPKSLDLKRRQRKMQRPRPKRTCD